MNEEPTVNQSNSTTSSTEEPQGQNVPQSVPTATPAPEKPKHSKKVLLLLLIVLLLVVVGCAAALVMEQTGKKQPAAIVNPVPTNSTQAPSATIAPYAVVYAKQTNDTAQPQNCLNTHTQLLLQPLDGGKQIISNNLGQNNSPSNGDVYKNKVAVVSDSGCGSKDGPAVWFSQDSGATYKKVFSGKPISGVDFDQITSVKFSSDGKAIIISFQPAGSTKAFVKEIDPATMVVKDLFTEDNTAVYVVGYDRPKSQVYFYEGCSACDGTIFNKLFVRDLAAGTEKSLFYDAAHGNDQTVPNADFSKLLLAKSTSINNTDATKPYDVEEFDIATKTSKVLIKPSGNSKVIVGYKTEDGQPYYADGTKIYSLWTGNVLFTASKPIVAIYYVGSDRIVASIGTADKFSVVTYSVSTKATTDLLDAAFGGDVQTTVFGVSLK